MSNTNIRNLFAYQPLSHSLFFLAFLIFSSVDFLCYLMDFLGSSRPFWPFLLHSQMMNCQSLIDCKAFKTRQKRPPNFSYFIVLLQNYFIKFGSRLSKAFIQSLPAVFSAILPDSYFRVSRWHPIAQKFVIPIFLILFCLILRRDTWLL